MTSVDLPPKKETIPPAYPFGTVTITPKAKALVNEALETGWVSCGKYVREFEQRFADLVGAREAVAVSSGTDAIALALAALYDFGAKRGDEVIVPALSFAATGNAILQAGLKPVFVEIELETLNINPDLIETMITDRTCAILPVHLMGKPAQMDIINRIAKRYDLWVVGDAAEAHGSQYKGRGVSQWADMTCYSLYVAHIISTVEGGIITTDRADVAGILRSLRSHGRFCKCATCVQNRSTQRCDKRHGTGHDVRFIFERIGFSTKMNELEAAIGLGNLETHDEILETRHHNLLYLIDAFKQFSPHLIIFEEGDDELIGPHAFPILVDANAPFTRDELIDYLSRKCIDPRDLFCSMPTQCQGFEFLGYSKGDFPHSEYVGNQGLHVGVHQGLTKEHLDYLVETVKDFITYKK